MTRNPGMWDLGECQYDNILAGPMEHVTEAVILQAGQVYQAGSVLGKVTATGLCTLVDSTKSDGSETILGILADEVDATAGDTPAIAYLSGEFNQRRMAFGGSDTVEQHKNDARMKGIFFKDTIIRDE